MLLWITIRKSWSLFQKSSWKIARSASWWRNHDDVISGLQKKLIISRTMHPRQKVIIDHYQEVKLALSETVMKNCLKRPLAEKSRWCQFRLAMKPRYLGNHASQIKSYYGSLSWSIGRFVISIKTANINSKNLWVYKCCQWRESLA